MNYVAGGDIKCRAIRFVRLRILMAMNERTVYLRPANHLLAGGILLGTLYDR